MFSYVMLKGHSMANMTTKSSMAFCELLSCRTSETKMERETRTLVTHHNGKKCVTLFAFIVPRHTKL